MSAGRTAQAVGKLLEQTVAAQLESATQSRLVVWSEHNQPIRQGIELVLEKYEHYLPGQRTWFGVPRVPPASHEEG